MQNSNAKQRGVKRKEGASVLKRKKRNAYMHFSPADIADIFRACPETLTRCTLLSSPATFLRQIHRTFQSEFPGYMPGAELVAAIVGQPVAPSSAVCYKRLPAERVVDGAVGPERGEISLSYS